MSESTVPTSNVNKEPLLFLCHRIPFPPNKGDKIRSFNILKELNKTFDVHLGCFIDDPFDKQYTETLKQHCTSLFTLEQNKLVAKVKGLTGFISGKPITLPYYFDKKMQQWVNRTIASENITKSFIYSSSMAQYLDNLAELPIDGDDTEFERVIDFVDVDSDKWRQYAEKKSGIAKWFFEREHKLLAKYEDLVCQAFSYSLFVSPDEAAFFRDRQTVAAQPKVQSLLNGVDVDFFSPEATLSHETLPEKPFISFTGAMDYWANVDAVLWFVEFVWPSIIAQSPEAIFVIVGGNPAPEIKALADKKGIVVTGRVHDVRPYIAKAACVVAPLQIARGIQNKVLEAMSLDKPIVLTSMAMEGINAPESSSIRLCDDANDYAQFCLDYLATVHLEKGASDSNRQWVLQQFTWKKTLAPLSNFFGKG